MPVESKIVTILDNVLWTTNSPQIFLSMYYTVRKDGEIILNRGKDTYTFEHITLVVSMPNRGSFYGYTVGARIFSGNYSTE